MWYKREEQALLNSIWYCMYGVQLMVFSDLTRPLAIRITHTNTDRWPNIFWNFPLHRRAYQKLATYVLGPWSGNLCLVVIHRGFPSG